MREAVSFFYPAAGDPPRLAAGSGTARSGCVDKANSPANERSCSFRDRAAGVLIRIYFCPKRQEMYFLRVFEYLNENAALLLYNTGQMPEAVNKRRNRRREH